MAQKAMQNWGEWSDLQLSSPSSKILQLCLPLTCMHAVWRKWPALRVQHLLIIHLEGLLVMLGALLHSLQCCREACL